MGMISRRSCYVCAQEPMVNDGKGQAVAGRDRRDPAKIENFMHKTMPPLGERDEMCFLAGSQP
jgi:hypothetical protein